MSWATWLPFTGVPAWCVVLLVRCPGPLGFCSPVCPLGLLCCMCGVLGHLAPVHRCARSACCVACAVSFGHLAPVYRCARCVCCVVCAVSWAIWLLFTVVPARCVALRVRCPGPLGSCSPVCSLGVLPVCAVSWATWLLFTAVPARRVVLLVRCPGPLDSCSPVCPLGPLLCVCGVLGHLAPVHRCARSACCVACAVSWATWLLFTGVPARRVVLRVRCPLATWLLFTGVPAVCAVWCVRCPGPSGSCSPLCPLGALRCVCGVLGHLALVHQCARSVCCLCVRCPGPLGSCSRLCTLAVLFCLCGVLGHLTPVHRCARSVRCFACAVSWATWLLFTGEPARCVVFLVRCPGPLGSCSPVCPLWALPVCAVSWATWLLFTGVPAWCVVLLVRCPGPIGSCSAVCPLGVLCCVCGVHGPLNLVHRCARPLCCAVSLATWLLFTGVRARSVVLWVACAGRRCGALTPSSGRWLFVAGRGWVPSGRTLVRPDAGCS